jgi:hypothetical protein
MLKKYKILQEEIAHYNITVDTKDSRKQEKEARSFAMERAVPLDDLIFCYNHYLVQILTTLKADSIK